MSGGRYKFREAKSLRYPMLYQRMLDSITRADNVFLDLLERSGRIEVCDCDAERGIWLAYFGLVQILVDKQDRIYFVHDRDAIAEYRTMLKNSEVRRLG